MTLRRNILALQQHKLKKTSDIILPREYQQVEYLETTGTQWIDTLIKPTINAKVKVIFSPMATTGGGYFGVRNDPYRFVCVTFNSGQDFAFALTYNGWVSNREKIVLGKKYVVEASNGTYSINDNTYTTDKLSTVSFNDTFQVGIYKSNATTTYMSSLRLFYLRIDDVTSIELIPCYRKSDHKPGMYDIINNKFYTNCGTGEFKIQYTMQQIQQDAPNLISVIDKDPRYWLCGKDSLIDNSWYDRCGNIQWNVSGTVIHNSDNYVVNGASGYFYRSDSGNDYNLGNHFKIIVEVDIENEFYMDFGSVGQANKNIGFGYSAETGDMKMNWKMMGNSSNPGCNVSDKFPATPGEHVITFAVVDAGNGKDKCEYTLDGEKHSTEGIVPKATNFNGYTGWDIKAFYIGRAYAAGYYNCKCKIKNIMIIVYD